MVHNLVARPDSLYITYDIDFVPASSPAAASIKPARPVWMDVENGKLYPVFDVFRGAGRKGKFTYPTQNPSAYAGRRRRPNKWRVDRDSVMIATAGHLHAGGLWNDLYLKRKGARYRGPNCAKRRTAAARARCRSTAPSVRGNRVRLFRSRAKYFEPLGPVSWDLAMTVTPQSYRVSAEEGGRAVHHRDLRVQARVLVRVDGDHGRLAGRRRPGVDPFRRKVDVKGKTTHGHLRENRVHGGKDIGADEPVRRGVGRVLLEHRDQQLRLPAPEVRGRSHTGGETGPVDHLHQHRRGEGHLPLGDLLPAAVQQVDGHRLPDRQRPRRVRLRPTGLRWAAHAKPQHMVHPEAAQARHLRLLLPHPPVDARSVPGQEVTLSAARS